MKKIQLSKSSNQYLKFIIVGAIGTILNLLILLILTDFFKLYYLFSETIAFFIAITHNYVLNKIWTFKENWQERPIQKYMQYVMISLIGLVVNLIILFILVEFFYIWYIFSEIIATTVSSVVNFFGNKFWTFRTREERISKKINQDN